ncbi:MAG: cytochrome c biogenesis protein CcdA [Nitrospirae bacterium]|nr:cytochrome c biogenesis protein CcdA [Nitrospirota bacterium]MBF0541647.1 cytochrome c biogenesis protein CcdA [Nitrospirota bacterium]
MNDVSYTMAFLAGVLSFVSPCVLPLLPSYVSFITGLSFEDLTGIENRRQIRNLTIINSLIFISGFSFVFIAMGASSSAIGMALIQFQDTIRIAGGVLVIIFGLFVTGIVNIKFLSMEKKIHLSGKPAGMIGTFFVGMTFAAGWTPCIGPMLGTILAIASTSKSVFIGLKLLTVYSLGLGVPFFISSLAVNSFLSYYKKLNKYMNIVKIGSGVLLILFGILLLTDRLSMMARYLPNVHIGL